MQRVGVYNDHMSRGDRQLPGAYDGVALCEGAASIALFGFYSKRCAVQRRQLCLGEAPAAVQHGLAVGQGVAETYRLQTVGLVASWHLHLETCCAWMAVWG